MEIFDLNTALEMVDNDKDLLQILFDGFLKVYCKPRTVNFLILGAVQ